MPTSAEFKALKAATYWAWDATDMGYYVFAPDASNTAGKIVEETNGLTKADALLFFPAAGYGNGGNLSYVGSSGRYWSGSQPSDDTGKAHQMSFDNSDVGPQLDNSRSNGRSVRPVYLR